MRLRIRVENAFAIYQYRVVHIQYRTHGQPFFFLPNFVDADFMINLLSSVLKHRQHHDKDRYHRLLQFKINIVLMLQDAGGYGVLF